VIKKKVKENARKAAKSTSMMDSAKPNDYILWIHLWQKEHQWSINDSWSCIMGNPVGDTLQIVINTVLSALIDKGECETLHAPR
jgi:hypothetical protein